MMVGKQQAKDGKAAEAEEGNEELLRNKYLQKSICQNIGSRTVPLPYVLVETIILGTVIIILIALLAFLAVRETPKTEVANHSAAADCKKSWVAHRGKCYYFSHQSDTWTDSQNYCKSHNSSLAIIDNETELDFLYLLKCNTYWIGLSRTQDDSGWVWTNGTFFSETLFDIHRKPPSPGESEHVFLDGDGFKSEGGKYKKKWICSKRF